MNKKGQKSGRQSTPQVCELVEITDPIEIIEFERRRKEYEEIRRGVEAEVAKRLEARHKQKARKR
jgi:hypothetical protein